VPQELAYVGKFGSKALSVFGIDEKAREMMCVRFLTASVIKVVVVGIGLLIDSTERIEKLVTSNATVA
jgi:hypothetical protein